MTCQDVCINWTEHFKFLSKEIRIFEALSKYAFFAVTNKIDEIIGYVNDIPDIKRELNDLKINVLNERDLMNRLFKNHKQYFSEFRKQKTNQILNKTLNNELEINIECKESTVIFLNQIKAKLYELTNEWNEILVSLKEFLIPSIAPEISKSSAFLKFTHKFLYQILKNKYFKH